MEHSRRNAKHFAGLVAGLRRILLAKLATLRVTLRVCNFLKALVSKVCNPITYWLVVGLIMSSQETSSPDSGDSRAVVRRILANYRELLTSHLSFERKLLDDVSFTETIFRGYRRRRPIHDLLVARGWLYDARGRQIPHAAIELEDLHKSVCVFWRDNGPRLVENIASISESLPIVIRPNRAGELANLGIYFDTILMEDFFETTMTPESAELWHTHAPAEQEWSFWTDTLGDYLSVCAILDAAFSAETDHLLVALFPRSATRPAEVSADEALKVELTLAQRMALHSLVTVSVLESIPDDFAEVGRAIGALTESNAALAVDELWRSGRLEEALPSLLRDLDDLKEQAKSRHTSAAKLILEYFLGSRTLQTRDAILLEQVATALRAVRGIPPGVWHASVDAMAVSQQGVVRNLGLPADYGVIAGLQAQELEWLHNVSYRDLIRIREAGVMEEVRSLFRSTRVRLQYASEDNFASLATDIVNNLMERLDAEQERLKRESAAFKKRLALTSLSFTAGTALGIATGILPALAPLAIPAAVASAVIGSKSLADLWKVVSERRAEANLARNRPIGILLEARAAKAPSPILRELR